MSRTGATLLTFVPLSAFAKTGCVDYSWGASALATMHDYIVTMMLYVLWIVFALASVMVVISSLQIFIKIQAGEEAKKLIMQLVGACMFMLGASIVLPAFFGYNLM